jgi:hypothetical protein
MNARTPMPGDGCFRWNTGSWFGSQTGGTLWMLVAALTCAPEAPWASAGCMCCFVVANGAGIWLWHRRDRLRPYPAMQLLVLIVAITGLLAMVRFAMLRPSGLELNANWKAEIRRGILMLLLGAPAFLAYMAFLERSVKKAMAKK